MSWQPKQAHPCAVLALHSLVIDLMSLGDKTGYDPTKPVLMSLGSGTHVQLLFCAAPRAGGVSYT